MQKDTVLYKAMVKYRRKNLLYNIIIMLFLAMFIYVKMPYIRTEINGPNELDMERYLNETGTFTVDELVELERHEEIKPPDFYDKYLTYWQDDNYLFEIKIDSLEKTDILFELTQKIGEKQYKFTALEIWYASSADTTFVVLAKPGAVFNDKLTGYLAQPSRSVIAPISETLQNGKKLVFSEYFIDCRGVEMATAKTDWALVKIISVVLLMLFIKLLVYYIRPKTTPTYRQLSRYGDIDDVADEVNRQAASPEAYIEDKKLITPDFILSDESFRKKVVKNHMNKN